MKDRKQIGRNRLTLRGNISGTLIVLQLEKKRRLSLQASNINLCPLTICFSSEKSVDMQHGYKKPRSFDPDSLRHMTLTLYHFIHHFKSRDLGKHVFHCRMRPGVNKDTSDFTTSFQKISSDSDLYIPLCTQWIILFLC